MSIKGEIFIDIKDVNIAHEYILDRAHKCEYPRGRGSYGLIYALDGSAEYRFLTGEVFTVNKGDVLLLSPHTAYSIATEKEFKHYTVNFDIHEETSELDALRLPYCLLRGENTEEQRRQFKKLVDLWRLKQTGYKMRSIGCLYELLSIFCFDCLYLSPYRRLLPAKEYIEQHFDLPMTLEHLAYLSNMSVTNFRREWKKAYSVSPLQYRDTVRLHYAKEYLNSGYYTVSEIAKRCGFEDVSYFVRFFRKKIGVTPRRFRERLR